MPAAQVATKHIAVDADQQSANVKIDINAQSNVATPWKVQVGTLNISGGQLKWLDQTLPSPAQVRLVGLSVNAAAIAYPFAAAAPCGLKDRLVWTLPAWQASHWPSRRALTSRARGHRPGCRYDCHRGRLAAFHGSPVRGEVFTAYP
jgi:hypothetical protein